MKYKLSKISKDLGYSISEIAQFLNSTGIDCSENPRELISIESFQSIQNNIHAYLKKNKSANTKLPLKSNLKTGLKRQSNIPVEIKIIEAASKEIKLTERIIGFTPYEWDFNIVTFTGESSQPVDFNLFDEVISDLLLIEEMSASKIGEILGLDIDNDPAENEILNNAINILRNDKMIDGDESILWLTDTGKEYAKNGVKFSTFKRDFDLYFDKTGAIVKNARTIFSEIKSEKINNNSIEDISLEEVKKLAEVQAPEVHLPENGYNLLNAAPKKSENFKAKLWVVLLENFRDNLLRALVYDEKQGKVIDELSIALDKQEEAKIELLDNLISLEEDIEYTNESKSTQQLELEKALIEKQEILEKAIENKTNDKIPEILNDVKKLKKHFDSIEFEIELKRLFDDTEDEIWIISPWIKNATLKRIPFFKNYINKGGKIFIAYSKPEGEGQVMAYDKPFNKLMEIENQHPNYFFLDQLPPFHYKNVWLRKADGENVYYSGSYNILSFFVKQNARHVRQEKMTRMVWDKEVEAGYKSVLKEFSLTYLDKIKISFNTISSSTPKQITPSFITKLRNFGNEKLAPFINKGIKEFDIEFEKFESEKSDLIYSFHKKYMISEVERFESELDKLSTRPMTHGKKKYLEKELNNLKKEAKDIPELEHSFSALFENLNRIRLSRSPHQHRFKTKKRR